MRNVFVFAASAARRARVISGLPDRHRDRSRQEREWQRDGRAKPDEPGRHERDLPEDHALKGEQRPGDDIGDHLRRAAADFHGHRADRKTDHRAARGGRARDDGGQHAEPAAVRPEPAGDDFRWDHSGNVARAEHAEGNARHDVDEVHAAFAHRRYQHHTAALPGHEAEDCDRAPQGDVDDQRGDIHEGSPFGYIRTQTNRPSAPARTGIGSEITIRHSVNSVPRIGNSQATARPQPIRVQLTTMAMVAPKSAPTVSNAAATGQAVKGPPGRTAPNAVPISNPFMPEVGPSARETLSCGRISAMNPPSRQPASTRGRISPNSRRSWVRMLSTPSMPSRRQTSAAQTATSAPITIIDQPTGLRARFGRVSPSSAGAGSFIGGSDKAIGRRVMRIHPAQSRPSGEANGSCPISHAPLRDAHARSAAFRVRLQEKWRTSARPPKSPAIESTTDPITQSAASPSSPRS